MSAVAAFGVTYGVSLVAAVLGLAMDAFGGRRASIAIVSAGLGIAAVGGVWSGMAGRITSYGPLSVGGAASLVFGVIAFVGCAAVAGGYSALRDRLHGGSAGALVAFSVAACGGIAATQDLVTLLLLLEAVALAGYALVVAAGTPRSAEAAVKYFVQGAVATGFLLFGIAMLAGLFEPTGEYYGLSAALSAATELVPAWAGAGLVLAALLFKMGAVPLHSWVPDAYETAPVESAAFLATGPKIAAVAAFAVFASTIAPGIGLERVTVTIAALAVASVLVGSVGALRQEDYRRLLAYAGIAQVGYALIAAALPSAPLAVVYVSSYGVASVGAFIAAAAFKRRRPQWDGSLGGLAGMGREAPLLCAATSVLVISLSGLPPLLGFWAKLLVFATGITSAVAAAGQSGPVAVALGVAVTAGILGSVISLGYYGRILKVLYFEEAADTECAGTDDGVEAAGAAASAASSLDLATGVVIAVAVLVIALSLVPLLLGPTGLLEIFTTS